VNRFFGGKPKQLATSLLRLSMKMVIRYSTFLLMMVINGKSGEVRKKNGSGIFHT